MKPLQPASTNVTVNMTDSRSAPVQAAATNPLYQGSASACAGSAPANDQYEGFSKKKTTMQRAIDTTKEAVSDFLRRPAGEMQREIMRNIRG